MFYTYVLFSPKLNKRYIGSTSDLTKRLAEHNAGKSRFTKSGIPWILVYSESYSSNSDARKRELFLKSGFGRKFLDDILKNTVGF